MVDFSVTLEIIRGTGACFEGYNRLVRSLQGLPFSEEDGDLEEYLPFRHEAPITLLYVLDSNGLNDALWALRCVEGVDRDARLFAVWCARQAQHLMADPRSVDALDVAERFANGMATAEELNAATRAADDANGAASGAAWAAAWAAAKVTVREAALAAALAAAWASMSVRAAAKAEGASAGGAQREMFTKMCRGEAPWQVHEGE